MPFEYGFIPEGEEIREPAGYITGGELHAIARYDYDGSYEVVVLRPRNERQAEVYILPQSAMDPEQPALDFDMLTEERMDGLITPSQEYSTHFQNEDGDQATLYVNYLPIGARVMFLADGQVKFVSDGMI